MTYNHPLTSLQEVIFQLDINHKDRVISYRNPKIGNLHKTYIVTLATPTANHYQVVLQKINTDIFSQLDNLALNYITLSQASKIQNKIKSIDDTFEIAIPEIIPAINFNANSPKSLFVSFKNEVWKATKFIDQSICYNSVVDSKMAFHGSSAFGLFETFLASIELTSFRDTISEFQNPKKRFEALRLACKDDECKRLIQSEKLITKILYYEDAVTSWWDEYEKGTIPTRGVHNDPKISNLLLPSAPQIPVSILDLDTCMKGSILYDFGDLLRTFAVTSHEGVVDSNKNSIDDELLEVTVKGFVSQISLLDLTKIELEMFPLMPSNVILTLACRFITDFLRGDTYFNVSYPEENLVKATNMFILGELFLAKQKQIECAIELNY
jgi:hypothetical protein